MITRTVILGGPDEPRGRSWLQVAVAPRYLPGSSSRVLRLEFQDVVDGYMDDLVAVVESIRFMSPEEAADLIGEP